MDEQQHEEEPQHSRNNMPDTYTNSDEAALRTAREPAAAVVALAAAMCGSASPGGSECRQTIQHIWRRPSETLGTVFSSAPPWSNSTSSSQGLCISSLQLTSALKVKAVQGCGRGGGRGGGGLWRGASGGGRQRRHDCSMCVMQGEERPSPSSARPVDSSMAELSPRLVPSWLKLAVLGQSGTSVGQQVHAAEPTADTHSC